MEYKTHSICNSCETIDGVNHSCNLSYNFNKFDLTKKFDEIHIERGHDGFIADILLNSSTSNEVIFIEFAVSHKCSEKKIKQGHRIVEFSLISEEELKSFASRIIRQRDENVKFYNFRKNQIVRSFKQPQSCTKKFKTFTVFKDGKAEKEYSAMSTISKRIQKGDTSYFEILEKGVRNDYYKLVQIASDRGVKVFNCVACRFCTKNRSYYSMLQEDLFCKKHRAQIEDPNNACKNFWRREVNNHYL